MASWAPARSSGLQSRHDARSAVDQFRRSTSGRRSTIAYPPLAATTWFILPSNSAGAVADQFPRILLVAQGTLNLRHELNFFSISYN